MYYLCAHMLHILNIINYFIWSPTVPFHFHLEVDLVDPRSNGLISFRKLFL